MTKIHLLVATISLLLLGLLLSPVAAFAPSMLQIRRQLFRSQSSSPSSASLSSPFSQLFVSREDYLQPKYTAPESPKHHDVERMVECASSDGLCDVDEMAEMIAEIDQANHGDSNADAPTQERDHVLKQALSLQMELTETRQAMQNMGLNQDGGSISPPSVNNQVHDHSFDHFVDYRTIGEFESH